MLSWVMLGLPSESSPVEGGVAENDEAGGIEWVCAVESP